MILKEHGNIEPSWAQGNPWYLMPSQYNQFLQEMRLSEKQYLEAIAELHEVIPLQKARSHTNKLLYQQESLIHENFHPQPFSVLGHHPLQVFLSGLPSSKWDLVDAVRLGRDLVESRNIDGLQKLRRRLGVFKEYTGALFEVELLAEIYRAKFKNIKINKDTPDFECDLECSHFLIEAKHCSVSVPRAITQNITLGLAFQEFGEFKITLLSGIGCNDKSINELVEQIVKDARSLISGELTKFESNEYLITHDPNLGPRAVSIQYGGNTEGRVHGALKEKERKLSKRGVRKNEIAIVALDLRSQFPASPLFEKYKDTTYIKSWLKKNMPDLDKWHNSARESARTFVGSSDVVSGALLWFPNSERAHPCTPVEYYKATHTMTLVTKQSTITAVGPSGLRYALRSEFSS